jgi:Flp pilus assembly protein TadG
MKVRSRSGRGQSLVEFALVFPIFILVLAGIIDFGFMLYSRMTVINAAREGARVAVVSIDNPTAIPSLVNSRILAVSSGLTSVPTGTSTCVADTSKHPSCDFVTGGAEDPLSGDSVRVTVLYTYSTFFPLLFGTSFDLSSSVQMVME